MKIGLISDTHDRIENLNQTIKILKKEKVAELIHCGDLTSPFMVKELTKFPGEVHCVFGNIDDRHTTTILALKTKNVKLYGDYSELNLSGKKIAFTHFPFFAEALALSGKYDAVFYGHTHEKQKEIKGKTLLVNPGELAGVKNKPSFAIYDTKKNIIKFFDLK